MTILKIGELVKFSKNQKGRHLLGEGWSSPEEQHCWSTSNASLILFAFDSFPTTDIILQIRLSAFCHESYAEVNEIGLEVNDVSVAKFTASSSRQTFQVSVNQKSLNRSGLQTIKLRPTHLLKPEKCCLKDTRSLGIDIEYLIVYNDMSLFNNDLNCSTRTNEDGSGSILTLDKSYHRLISGDRSNIFLHLYAEGIFEDLFKKNLIPANLLQTNLVGKNIVLSLQTCKSIYGARYPFSMLMDCARLWLKLNIILANEVPGMSLGLCDCHYSNFVQGSNAAPLWCDIGSITMDVDAMMVGMKQFIQTLSIPLLMLRYGFDPVHLRHLLHSNPLGIDICSENTSLVPHETLKVFSDIINSRDIISSLVLLKEIHDSLELSIGDMQWSSYRGKEALFSSLSGDLLKHSPDSRYSKIIDTISELRVNSYLDIGCNDGLFSLLLTQLGMEGCAADIDEKALDKFYLFLRENQVYSPGLGIFSFTDYDYCEWATPPELVIALALTHHLSLSQGISFEQIAKRLHDLTSRYVLTEFMPFGLGGSASHPEPIPYPLPDYYSIDNFIASLKLYFFDVRRIDYARDKEHEFYSERILILCERNLI